MFDTKYQKTAVSIMEQAKEKFLEMCIRDRLPSLKIRIRLAKLAAYASCVTISIVVCLSLIHIWNIQNKAFFQNVLHKGCPVY